MNIIKKDLLLKYAKILQKYREHLKSPAHSYLNEIVTADSWCKAIVETTVKIEDPKKIIAFKFENVYEWMIGEYFNNQIRSEHNRIFINQDKKNIPDIVCERVVENPKIERSQKSCCIIDAKYYGWDEQKEVYDLPKSLDIYKIENSEDVGVYNFLILLDYLGDTKGTKWGIIRRCAVIEFDYHPGQSIAILQIDVDKFIDCILNEEYEQDLLIALLGNHRVKPME